METSTRNVQHPVSPEIKRFRLTTLRKNNIFVEEVNKSELELLWNSISEVQLIF